MAYKVGLAPHSMSAITPGKENARFTRILPLSGYPPFESDNDQRRGVVYGGTTGDDFPSPLHDRFACVREPMTEVKVLAYLSSTKKALKKSAFFVVPKVGLEPTRCRHHRILSPTRLPFHHFGEKI